MESKNSSGDNSGSSNSSDDSSDDDNEDKFKRLTDEELFKACGGLTAHKYDTSNQMLNPINFETFLWI